MPDSGNDVHQDQKPITDPLLTFPALKKRYLATAVELDFSDGLVSYFKNNPQGGSSIAAFIAKVRPIYDSVPELFTNEVRKALFEAFHSNIQMLMKDLNTGVLILNRRGTQGFPTVDTIFKFAKEADKFQRDRERMEEEAQDHEARPGVSGQKTVFAVQRSDAEFLANNCSYLQSKVRDSPDPANIDIVERAMEFPGQFQIPDLIESSCVPHPPQQALVCALTKDLNNMSPDAAEAQEYIRKAIDILRHIRSWEWPAPSRRQGGFQ